MTIFTVKYTVNIMWIYEQPDWPHFKWNAEALAYKLADIRYRQGLLLGKMAGIGFDLKQEASLKTLTSDIVTSSAIEGELLNREEVHSSIARRLGIDIAGLVPASRNIDGFVEMMIDATHNFSRDLTEERLFAWHSALFPTGRSGMYKIAVGQWRTPESGAMQVVSGPVGREKIHFEAPHADKISDEMVAFLNWFNSDTTLDPIIKAGVAHLWFVTIHPFEDGNGRIARAITDMLLARADGISERFYSLSSQIEAERKDYYFQLERQQKGTADVTGWLEWFLDCLGRALERAENTLKSIRYKTELWNHLKQFSVNERQRMIINLMLDDSFEGYMNTSKYAKLAKCSNDTALRDIQELKSYGLFVQNSSGGRSTSYRLRDPV